MADDIFALLLYVNYDRLIKKAIEKAPGDPCMEKAQGSFPIMRGKSSRG